MKSINTHSCKEVLKKVFLVLDGEMNDEEEKLFLIDISNCPRCLEVFNIEKNFKEFLITKIEKKQVSPTVIASIKDKIREIEIL